MFSHSPSSKRNTFRSSKSQFTEKNIQQTEEQVLFNYIPCIPTYTQDLNIQEIINKSQIQYQQQQQQHLLSLKRSSEHLDSEKEKSHTNTQLSNNPQALLNTPLYTKIVIDKIINQLCCPSDEQEVELHILHMKQLAQEQEKTIQKAMIEGEKSRFNRKACEFSSIEREQPQRYDPEYYEQQLQLQQQYLKGSQQFNKHSSDTFSIQQQPQFSYPQSSRDSGAFEQGQKFLGDINNNILQSRSSNITYTSNSNNVLQSNSKATSNNPNNLGQSNFYNDSLKQNSNLQSSQVPYQQQQQTNLIPQQENNQENKYKSSSKNNKENKSSSAGKENSSSSVGIINSKISKDSKNKKRPQTHQKIQQNQNNSSLDNSINASNPPSNNLPQLHQQMSAPPQIGQQQNSSINQQQANTNNYNRYPNNQQQNQQFYGTTYGFKNMYPFPHQNPIYYSQGSYSTPNCQPYLYPQNSASPYYYPQQPAQRISNNFSNQYCNQNSNNINNTHNNNNSNQPLFPKQDNYIEENGDIGSQIESPLIEINSNVNNNNNNHSLNQSHYDDFFRNQDQDQQMPLQNHISPQMSLQQSSIEDQLDQGEDDDMINNYLS